VWKVTEVTTSGSTNASPQPGLFIFTRSHYSMVRLAGTNPRPPLTQSEVASATADQLRAVWGPLTAQAGTYEVTGGQITTTPIVAKLPGNMKAGFSIVRSFTIQGNTLTLTDVRNTDGPATDPTTITLARVE
jgi:hypothetical protein